MSDWIKVGAKVASPKPNGGYAIDTISKVYKNGNFITEIGRRQYRKYGTDAAIQTGGNKFHASFTYPLIGDMVRQVHDENERAKTKSKIMAASKLLRDMELARTSLDVMQSTLEMTLNEFIEAKDLNNGRENT